MTHPPDLHQLRYFLAVADTLNFRAAAARLNIAQPAISRAVRTLEERLGHRLFDRTTRHVSLTAQGAALAEGARHAQKAISRALRHMDQIAAGDAGEITIGYSAQAAHGPMSRLLVRFEQRYPDIRIRLWLMSSEEQLSALQEAKIDLGFLLSDAITPELFHIPVARERFIALLPIGHRLAAAASVRLADLRDEPFVLGSSERWKTFRALIEGVCLREGFRPVVAQQADDVPLLLGMVAAGLGVTLYGQAISQALEPTVIGRPLAGKGLDFSISIAWHPDRMLPCSQRLIDFARQVAENGA